MVSSSTSRPGERGVALILVLVILPLVAIVLTQLHFEAMIGGRLSENILAHTQFRFAIEARINQVRQRLVRDLKEDEENQQTRYDHYGDAWGPKVGGGGTSRRVRKGDPERGDEVVIYTEITDEQGKFNINLLRHRDIKRRGKPFEVLTTLLDLFRDAEYADVVENEWDLSPNEAKEVAEAIKKFTAGEAGDGMVPKAEVPDPHPDLKQGVYTIEDLVFCHPLFVEKRLMESFMDAESGQVLPSLSEFLTIYGDGKINANTAPIQVLRALFREEEGRRDVAERILDGRGGFLNNDEDLERQQEDRERRDEMRLQGEDPDDDQELSKAYDTLNKLSQVDGMGDQGFLKRNDIDVARDFTIRTMFFSVVISARRKHFLRQHRLVLERHNQGCLTWESEIRTADIADLPEGEQLSED